MHHFGSGICSHTRFSTGAIFSVTVPPRSSGRPVAATAEHFRSKPGHIEPRGRRSDHLDRAARQPNVSGQMALFRAQLKT